MIYYRGAQNKVRKLLDDINDEDYRTQFHPALSPIGWHLGHCLYIENYWLREVLGKDNSLTEGLDKLYIPEKSPKPERGGKLPERDELLETAVEYQDNNALLVLEMVPPYSEQALFDNEYIQFFIIQHYAQHYETMCMVLQQRALQQSRAHIVQRELRPLFQQPELIAVEAGHYEVGSDSYLAYDNESPRHLEECKAFRIAAAPVSNAEYLAFMQDKGYQRRELWSEAGWNWCQQQDHHAPEHWRQDESGKWFYITLNGPDDIEPTAAVYGINYFEANALARWRNARLPHEHEWEIALEHSELPNTGHAWEWCQNQFYPYEGFKAFPYEGYSTPWFDQPHYVLKGGSPYTQALIRRSSFRNFYEPDKRHQFAGCRLVFD